MHVYYSPLCLKHAPPPNPAFAPKRLAAIVDALRAPGFDSLIWHEPPCITPEDLQLIHTPEYIANVLRPMTFGEERLLATDTWAVEGTAEAVLAAAGTVMTATEDVFNGRADQAFCLVSPGGHHAEADTALGFCFFNHVALAAIAAQKKMGARRIAVIDFDAHHGNGTQSLFWNFEDRLYISLHEDNPLSGFAHETGAWNNIINIPLPPKSAGDILPKIFDDKIEPKISEFKPDILFVSAGFDMHVEDPLSSLRLLKSDYRCLGKRLDDLSKKYCQNRLIGVLEGGYNLDVLGPCVASFIGGVENLK